MVLEQLVTNSLKTKLTFENCDLVIENYKNIQRIQTINCIVKTSPKLRNTLPIS